MKWIRYKSGYKYQLYETYQARTTITPAKQFDNGYVAITKEGILTIRKGYAWDGPSGPAIDTKSFMKASLVHDALYQLLREKAIPKKHRKTADHIMYVLCRADGMWLPRALWCYLGVRLFAHQASTTGRPVLVAP